MVSHRRFRALYPKGDGMDLLSNKQGAALCFIHFASSFPTQEGPRGYVGLFFPVQKAANINSFSIYRTLSSKNPGSIIPKISPRQQTPRQVDG